MAKITLGSNVIYRAHERHHNETVKEDQSGEKVTLQGSVHHAEMREFAGLVGRVRDGGKFDVIIFPPNGAPKWVDDVAAGTAAHEIRAA